MSGRKHVATDSSRQDPGDERFLRVLRPLVESYFSFLRRSDRHIRTLGLTPPQFDVVVTLGDADGMTCKELSHKTLVTKGTLTGVMDRLQAKGLIERSPSLEDRRCTVIRLTAQGNRLFRKVFPAHVSYMKPYFERALSDSDMKDLRRMLLRLKTSFEKI